jgi:hypothetical protein
MVAGGMSGRPTRSVHLSGTVDDVMHHLSVVHLAPGAVTACALPFAVEPSETGSEAYWLSPVAASAAMLSAS